jgi:hypothetical protein
MRPAVPAGLIAAAVALAGCGHHAVEINPKAEPVTNSWNAVLATPAGLAGAIQMRGTAWMAPKEKDPSRTRAHVDITNAAPGGVHPWHVHIGQCANDMGILGPPEAYHELKVGGDGKASADAELPVAMPTAGQYFVNVHASAQNMSTIVACGNLAPPAH